MSAQACIDLQNRLWLQPNEYNHALDVEAKIWNSIIRRGGLEMTCAFQKQRRYDKPPWEAMPTEGERLNQLASIPLPAVELTDTPVLDFTMPLGWDGVATNIMMTVAGSGFVEGSGDVIWRLKVGERWIPDFKNVIFQLNDLRNPHQLVGGYIRLLSLQRVQIFVFLGAGALTRLNASDRINAGVVGWTYPKR